MRNLSKKGGLKRVPILFFHEWWYFKGSASPSPLRRQLVNYLFIILDVGGIGTRNMAIRTAVGNANRFAIAGAKDYLTSK